MSTPISPTIDKREKLLYALLLILAGALLGYGWKLFWFLIDDAYIFFSYISNWTLGHGLVWNPPPFRPVEGYTNFLWLALLYAVWQVLGIAPPQAANYLALLFALGSLYIISRMLLCLRWTAALRPYRLAFLAFLLLGITTNRTFLAWSSSGLETAMFGCFVLAWTHICALISPAHRNWPLALSTYYAKAVGAWPESGLRNDGLQDQSVLYVADSVDAAPRVLIDPNTFSADATISLGSYSVSHDGQYIAYSISDGGSDWKTWKIRAIATGEDLEDIVGLTSKKLRKAADNWQQEGKEDAP